MVGGKSDETDVSQSLVQVNTFSKEMIWNGCPIPLRIAPNSGVLVLL